MYWVLTGTHIPTAMPKGNSLVSSLDDDFIERPRPVHELCPAVHPKLEELIMECVEVDASKRPNDMHGVADRLSLILGILRAAEEREKGDASPAA
jgi:hypothetical protein